MFHLPISKVNQWDSQKVLHTHKVYVNSMNIYMNTVQLIANCGFLIDRDTFLAIFEEAMRDIPTPTAPIDTFFPDDVDTTGLSINKNIPEYKSVMEIMTEEKVMNLLPPSELKEQLFNKKIPFELFQEHLFIHFMTEHYLREIQALCMAECQNFREPVKYIVENATLEQFKDFIQQKKVNTEKLAKYTDDHIFSMEYNVLKKFYNGEVKDCPKFDVEKLINTLFTNITLKSDIYIIISIYITLICASTEFEKEERDINDKCSQYVIDVLSKIL